MADILTSNLYPPIIESFMPAFTTDYCIVKFALSDMNSISDINRYAIQIVIKNQKNNKNSLARERNGVKVAPAGVLLKEIDNNGQPDSDGLYSVTINATDMIDNTFYKDQLYKLQIRFTAAEVPTPASTTGPDATWLSRYMDKFSEWSSVCLLKHISEPTIALKSLILIDEDEYSCVTPFLHLNETLSFGSNENEYLSSYQVRLYRKIGESSFQLLEESDIIYNSEDTFVNKIRYNFKYLLIANAQGIFDYKLEIDIATNNLYTQTFVYNFVVSASTGVDMDPIFDIRPDIDQGRMQVAFSIPNFWNDGIPHTLLDDKALEWVWVYRTSNKSEFITTVVNGETVIMPQWELIEKIHIFNSDLIYDPTTEHPPTIYFYDNTIEAGTFYQYGITLMDKGLSYPTVSSRFVPDTINDKPNFVMCDFEDIFLNTKNKQLKLRFDSRITSYKRMVMENKVETIGSRFPFIRRNTVTNYKQFSLNGLITFHMDDANIFLTEKKIYGGRPDIPEIYQEYNLTHGINPYNDYTKEREFREQVIDFLNSGKVMRMRSMTEGNLIVRLMDINITPNQNLNNLICSFTATVIEMAEDNFENYEKYNLYQLPTATHIPGALITEAGHVSHINITPINNNTPTEEEEEPNE